ncbi:hypothetical protein CERZMDRAFT_115222 [Cercospora zeae-maydis SCOH1-5]|uniref:Aminoglycoside phosphotransferase domain-containing protein n=1 Tax=Cercospora zeae-maydis SCOH1-5 TaxID=717836 RepID=A0A6A6F239_9PEZI|nr:hypothetical protein CERZMDRAFT_115222 [Cercospora zeae-maydis SCOH1-5]
MDRNECREVEDRAARWQWVLRYTEIRKTKLCAWVSTFHPQNLTCQTDGPDSRSDKRGSYGIVCKIRFDVTGETWAVRFPQGGSDSISDEKLEAEVAAINLVRRQTDIPIPEIKGWGLARDNELGLGPFMLSTWVDGISLYDILTQDEASCQGRMIRATVTDATIEHIWRQIARFMLQLSQISFDYIGSCTTTPRRPLTIKSYHIRESGVDIPCPVSTTFTSSIDYFKYVASHDLRHVNDQLNSVDDEEDARQEYINWNVLQQLVPRFVHSDHGPFRLICDDFGPMNMIVNNTMDLRIVAVLDWEWSYAGPQELFWSPPLWLLGQHPVCWEDGFEDSRLSRYHRNLDILIKVMQEEEVNILKSTRDSHHLAAKRRTCASRPGDTSYRGQNPAEKSSRAAEQQSS